MSFFMHALSLLESKHFLILNTLILGPVDPVASTCSTNGRHSLSVKKAYPVHVM